MEQNKIFCPSMKKWSKELEKAVKENPNAEAEAWEDPKCLQLGYRIGNLILAYPLSSFRHYYKLKRMVFLSPAEEKIAEAENAEKMAIYRTDVERILSNKGKVR